jgi:hypothetical protein
MNNNDIKSRIVSGINYAKEKLGFTLVHSAWGSKQEKCACALGCVLIANDRHLEDVCVEDNESEAASVLGVSTVWVESFINGFDDGEEHEVNTLDVKARELGIELRKELSPKEHTTR